MASRRHSSRRVGFELSKAGEDQKARGVDAMRKVERVIDERFRLEVSVTAG